MLKILLLDIETAPKKAFVWGMWKQNVAPVQLISDWFMLTWAAKWYHDDHVYGARLSRSEVAEEDDGRILTELWHMMDEADVIIGHNGDKFDIPSINTRFAMNKMTPPSPYRTVDTLKIAKRHFKFSFNRLDYLGEMLGVGRKIDTGGFDLWKRCLDGDVKSLEEMLDYNKQDVVLLQKVYDELRPFCKTHPSHGAANAGDEPICPKCGSVHLQSRGYAYTNTARYQRFRCVDCGGWSRGRTNTRTSEQMKATVLPL